MSEKRIIKTIANGYEVPYPYPLFSYDFNKKIYILVDKDYRLNDFPKHKDGTYKIDISGQEYDEWLVDYLYHSEIELTEEQKLFKDQVWSDPKTSGACIGFHGGAFENFGYRSPQYIYPDNFEAEPDFENLKSYANFVDPYDDFIENKYEDDIEVPTRQEFILEDYGWHLIKRRHEEDFKKYFPDFTKLETLDWMSGVVFDDTMLEFPDFAWRVYLSILLKKFKNKSDRIHQITLFHNAYAEDLHK